MLVGSGPVVGVISAPRVVAVALTGEGGVRRAVAAVAGRELRKTVPEFDGRPVRGDVIGRHRRGGTKRATSRISVASRSARVARSDSADWPRASGSAVTGALSRRCPEAVYRRATMGNTLFKASHYRSTMTSTETL